jgi:hypothetical protein
MMVPISWQGVKLCLHLCLGQVADHRRKILSTVRQSVIKRDFPTRLTATARAYMSSKPEESEGFKMNDVEC